MEEWIEDRAQHADRDEDREPDPRRATPRERSPQREQLATVAEAGDAPDDERDQAVLDDEAFERRPPVQHVRVRPPAGNARSVAPCRERQDESEPPHEPREP